MTIFNPVLKLYVCKDKGNIQIEIFDDRKNWKRIILGGSEAENLLWKKYYKCLETVYNLECFEL